MKYFTLFLFLFLAQLDICAQVVIDDEGFETFSMTEGDTTFLMKKYFLCMYTSGPNRGQDQVDLAQLQKDHLAYQGDMAKNKKLCLAGPFGDNGEWRGILILNVPNENEAKNLINNDPMVKAGRLAYILKPWWGAVGTALY
jgi:uncharacterized protein YciI